jgi:hypothetical protein
MAREVGKDMMELGDRSTSPWSSPDGDIQVGTVFRRQGSAPCLGCSVYYAAVGHGKGAWDATGGLLKKIAFAGFVLPSLFDPGPVSDSS